MIIHLSAPEARLCRDAAKAQGKMLFPSVGDIELAYADWHDMQNWLTWYSTDYERRLKLDTRLAAERLSIRIAAHIAPFKPKPEPAKRQRDLFAGAEA